MSKSVILLLLASLPALTGCAEFDNSAQAAQARQANAAMMDFLDDAQCYREAHKTTKPHENYDRCRAALRARRARQARLSGFD